MAKYTITFDDYTVKTLEASGYSMSDGFTTFYVTRHTGGGPGSDQIASYPSGDISSIEVEGKVTTQGPTTGV